MYMNDEWKSNCNLTKVKVFYVFEFFIRLDFKKGKLKKKSRLKIEKLSAFDIMVIENAISAISVSILRPFL